MKNLLMKKIRLSSILYDFHQKSLRWGIIFWVYIGVGGVGVAYVGGFLKCLL